MKEFNKVFLRMISAVCKYAKGNEAINSMPAAKELLTKSDTLIGKTEKVLEFVVTENKSVVVAVTFASEKVVAPLYAVIKALEVYFTKQNNTAMVAELHITRTEIKRATYKAIQASVKSVLKIARDNLTNLAIYNITEEQLAAIEANMQQLTTANTALEAYQEEKRVKRVELDALIEEGKELLNEMDMVVDIISLTHPEAFKGYTEVRNKKEYTELLFTISVVNSETGKPEENARVVVQSTTKKEKDKPYVLIDRRTGKSGEIRNNKREFDIYEMIVEKIGCETHIQQFTVADNTPLRLEVMLKKKEGVN